jgi:hypothetical protein
MQPAHQTPTYFAQTYEQAKARTSPLFQCGRATDALSPAGPPQFSHPAPAVALCTTPFPPKESALHFIFTWLFCLDIVGMCQAAGPLPQHQYIFVTVALKKKKKKKLPCVPCCTLR